MYCYLGSGDQPIPKSAWRLGWQHTTWHPSDPVRISLGCQPSYSWGQLKPKQLGTPVKDFVFDLKRVTFEVERHTFDVDLEAGKSHI